MIINHMLKNLQVHEIAKLSRKLSITLYFFILFIFSGMKINNKSRLILPRMLLFHFILNCFPLFPDIIVDENRKNHLLVIVINL